MSFILEQSDRLTSLPPYLFVEIDKAKRRAIEKGTRVLDFGIGDPDQPTPAFIIRAMAKAMKDPATHKYPLDRGNAEFRKAAAQWLKKRFGIAMDPVSEVLPLIGSKEGITHLPLAFVNPGDLVLLPDPGYPAYRSGVLFAGGRCEDIPMKEANGFLPDLDAIPEATAREAKLIYVNYPNNPTAAFAPLSFYKALVAWAKKYKVLVASDLAYSEVYFGKERPASIFEAPGAREVAIEFHSLSKSCNMTGWRIGFAIGSKEVIDALLRVKSNVDSGVFTAIQKTGIEALKQSFSVSKKFNAMYKKRRDLLVAGLKRLGFPVKPNPGTFYVFTRLPKGHADSTAFAKELLERVGIVATPGVGFGASGEGYIRFSLTVSETQIKQALQRMKKVF